MERPGTWTLRGVVSAAGLCLALAAPSPGAAADVFQCRASATQGIPEADAATAVTVVCEAVAHATHRAAGSYTVAVSPLGRSIVVRLVNEATTDSRSLVIADLDDVPTAGQRLALALTTGRDVESTQALGTLLPSETREMREKSGSLKASLGAVGLSVPSQNAGTGAGFTLGLGYRTANLSLYGDLVWAWSSASQNASRTFAIGPGARYYLSKRSVSPYVGGGAGLLYLGLDRDGFSGSKSSFAPNLEVGVECLRLHHAQLTAGVRAYLPFAKVPQTDYGYYYGSSSRPAERSLYAVPIVFGLAFSFGG
jgi:hypothetical protein